MDHGAQKDVHDRMEDTKKDRESKNISCHKSIILKSKRVAKCVMNWKSILSK